MNTGATIGVGGLGNGGRALAMNGALTLDTNVITPPPGDCAFAAAPTATPIASATPTPTVAATPTPVVTATPTPVHPSSPGLPDTRLEVTAGTPIAHGPLLALAALASVVGLTALLVSSRRRA
jgi:hypothetical protein